MSGPPCPPELWPQLSPLLDAALELPPEARGRWLAEQDSALRPHLERILFSATRALDAPAVPAAPQFEAGQLVGGHRLERLLGQGGMGEVWLAHRADGSLKRAVALKLPHAFLLAGATRARFERERDILATLTHPHIAALHEAGVDGEHPWLAMEFVAGESITDYCRRTAAPLERRLALFRQVLEAVEHAHTRFIAHRDLKPGNILVTGEGQVKLLDFGIAKLLDAEGSGEATELTRLGGRAITPEYAAPEQLSGDAVTAASDLYSLGIVLYELLSGQRPFDAVRAQDARTEPPRLATRVVDGPAHRVGSLSRTHLQRALRGDLDAIVARALEPDPRRRYRSATAFAEDLDRHARLEPLQARPLGTLSRLVRAARRHKVRAALLAALAGVVMAGVGGVVWQGLRAEREAERALQEAAVANQVSRYLVSLFDAMSPERTGGELVQPRRLVDQGRALLDRELPAGSSLRPRLLGTLGTLYAQLGFHQDAIQLLNEALDAPGGWLSLRQQAEFLYQRGRSEQELDTAAEARKSLEAALERIVRLPPTEIDAELRRLRARSHALLGFVRLREGAVNEGKTLLDQALAEQEAMGDAAGTPNTLTYLAEAYSALGDSVASAKAVDEALARQTRLTGADDPATLRLLAHKVEQLYFAEQAEEGVRLALQALERFERVFGTDAQPTVSLRFRLATLLFDRGAVSKALEQMKRVAATEITKGEQATTNHAQALEAIGRYQTWLGDLKGAEASLERSWSIIDAGPARTTRTAEIVRLDRARVLIEMGRLRDAESLLSPEIAAHLQGPLADASRARRQQLRAMLALRRGEVAAAQAAVSFAWQILGPDNRPTLFVRQLRETAALVDAAAGKRAAAISELRDLLAEDSRRYAPDAPWTRHATEELRRLTRP